MRDYREFFEGKKITLMGLGLLGRGVGDGSIKFIVSKDSQPFRSLANSLFPEAEIEITD